MRRCPTCNRTYTDQKLSFCIDDGTPLVPVSAPVDATTVVSPSSDQSRNDVPPTQSYLSNDRKTPAYQPPGSYVPPRGQTKRKVWPWVVGTLAALFLLVIGLGIAAAILIPNMMRAASNRNSSNLNANVEQSDNYNSNLNSNARGSDLGNSNLRDLNENANHASDEEQTPPPTDEDEVLATLTDLEHEWTVANINADKKKLDRILADDFVGTPSDGKRQGKAEYIRTIERDTTIQKWDFEDLKVNLKGERATLTGVLKLQIRDEEVEYRFRDKFVWRDGRWQATSSEVTPTK
jgi:hypothetical protein